MACKGTKGVGLCGVRAASGKGEHLLAFKPSPGPILTLPAERLAGTRFTPRSDDDEPESFPLCGTLPARELPSGSFLSRTAFVDCS